MEDTALREDDPGFREPWQAQAFAITMRLSQRGVFTWAEWVSVFSAEIAAHPAQPEEDSTDAYYRQWLAALETILGACGASSSPEIDAAQARWRRAYLNTPHGTPIALENADPACAHDHDHEHELQGVRQPVAISAAETRGVHSIKAG